MTCEVAVIVRVVASPPQSCVFISVNVNVYAPGCPSFTVNEEKFAKPEASLLAVSPVTVVLQISSVLSCSSEFPKAAQVLLEQESPSPARATNSFIEAFMHTSAIVFPFWSRTKRIGGPFIASPMRA